MVVHRLLAAALRLNPSLTQLPPELRDDTPQPGPPLDCQSQLELMANPASQAGLPEATDRAGPSDAAQEMQTPETGVSASVRRYFAAAVCELCR